MTEAVTEGLLTYVERARAKLLEIAAALEVEAPDDDGAVEVAEKVLARINGPAATNADFQRVSYELAMDDGGRRYFRAWLGDRAVEMDPLPAGFELRVYSEAPVDGKIDGEETDANLQQPIGTRVTLEIPTGALARKFEVEALSRVLRRQLVESAAARRTKRGRLVLVGRK